MTIYKLLSENLKHTLYVLEYISILAYVVIYNYDFKLYVEYKKILKLGLLI